MPNRRRTAARFLSRALAAIGLCLLVAACASTGDAGDGRSGNAASLPPLESLMGEWHVAARVPWFGERGRVASRLEFSRDGGDSRIQVTRTWREGFSQPLETDSSTARRQGSGHRIWTLRTWGLLPSRLQVLEVAEDGSWLLLAASERDHAWILTRAQRVGDEAYLELERRIGSHGVNTDKLRRVPQVPEQEGRLGFEPAAVPTPGR